MCGKFIRIKQKGETKYYARLRLLNRYTLLAKEVLEQYVESVWVDIATRRCKAYENNHIVIGGLSKTRNNKE